MGVGEGEVKVCFGLVMVMVIGNSIGEVKGVCSLLYVILYVCVKYNYQTKYEGI